MPNPPSPDPMSNAGDHPRLVCRRDPAFADQHKRPPPPHIIQIRLRTQTQALSSSTELKPSRHLPP
ncbi:hypothetical protein TIFTF001_054206 [Ficus carica]|uniref:Uncharacterized protein n=1 Tax=Ficus carica TaxID=3494 RepID=A0AA88ED63_FICCA|nr:hypothetical protein TIFTF001_054206 [Ficus carica]